MKKWTPEEIQYLREHYPTGCRNEIAKALGVTPQQVKSAASNYKIKRAPGYGHKKWLPEEIEYLRKNYATGNIDEIISRLGATKLAVYQQARILGLKRDPELVKQTARALMTDLSRKNLGKRFEKGHVSHNKGKRMDEWLSKEAQENLKKTQFKKGHVPHNYVPVGYERITRDGYAEIKVRDADDSAKNFVLKHRLIWEKVNGPVPAGMMVKFKDGNRSNIHIDNLYLSTMTENAAENIQRWHELPPDIKQNIKLIKQLKKALQ